jgi:serine/threonine-protein kinase HipA
MSHVDYKKIGTNSYAQLFDTAGQLDLPYSDREEIFRRMAFNVVARNCDDHSKNFSFRLRRGGAWALAPAYDVTFAHNPASKWTHQHLMSINGRFAEIAMKDLLEVADRFGIGTARNVLNQVQMSITHWPEFAQKTGVHHQQVRHIQDQLTPLPP